MTRSTKLRIGVDVGGYVILLLILWYNIADSRHSTNTDGVILDLAKASGADRGIVAWKKSSTTKDPNDGINNVIQAMFEQSNIDPRQIASVTLGTTHFINAVVERDRERLAKVGVVRLCGPFSKDIPRRRFAGEERVSSSSGGVQRDLRRPDQLLVSRC